MVFLQVHIKKLCDKIRCFVSRSLHDLSLYGDVVYQDRTIALSIAVCSFMAARHEQ